MQDLIGRTLGHYRIVDKIGEGGMGEVCHVEGTLVHSAANPAAEPDQ